MKKKKKRGNAGLTGVKVLVVILCVMLVMLLGRTAYVFSYQVFDQEAMTTEARAEEVVITVEEGMSLYEVATMMEKAGLIESAEIFWVQEKVSDYRGKLQAGEYTLSTSMTPDELLSALSGE